MAQYNCTLEFETGLGRTGLWTVTRTFNGVKHLDNFIDYILRTKGYHLDECYINSGYPFDEGEIYYTIENGEVVESCWDETSQEIHDANPNQMYFFTKHSAIVYAYSVSEDS
ncbi:MAG TPA: hypothetical protein EYO58_06070 [Flavobacteriales bacterium]|nr:hypothetical protein [Flavobacteriales bacterium]